MKMKHLKLLRIIAIVITCMLSLTITMPVLAQIHEPDDTFIIGQVEVYRHVLEENDQLYLITGTIEYTTIPVNINVTQSYLVRLRNAAGVELGQTTFYAYHNDGYDYGMCSIYFSAAEVAAVPVGWNQPYTIHFDGNPTLHWLDTTATHSMTGAVAYDATLVTFTNETVESNDAAAGDMNLLPAALPVVDDAYYFGNSSMFDTITITYSQACNGWTGTYTYEYWNGSAWVDVDTLSDPTIGFSSAAGNYDISWDCSEDWQTTTVSGMNLYWTRFRIVAVTGGGGAQPLGSQSWTNSMDDPPSIQTASLTWIDEGAVADAQARLTTRLRSLAQTIETAWGGAPAIDLIEAIGGSWVLTVTGEDYFSNSILNLRLMCPNLFRNVMETPDFTERYMVNDLHMGGDDGADIIYGANNWYAQTFTPAQSYAVDGVWLKVYRTGLPGILTVSLRATLAGVPTGGDLAVGTIDADEFVITDTGEWYWVTFTSDYTVTAGTVYSIVIRALAGNVVNYVDWRVDNNGGYADGQSCFYNGAIWTGVPADDFMFAVTATNAMELSYRNQLANRLIGTRFDMTTLGSYFGLSRMWASTLVWFALCCPVAWAISKVNNSYKPMLISIAILSPMGALAGFIYLEVAVLIAFFFSLVAIFSIAWKGAP